MTTIVGSGTGANYAVVAGALAALEDDGLAPTRLVSTSGSGLPFAFRARGGNMREFLAPASVMTPVRLIRPNLAWPLVPGIFHLDAVGAFLRQHVSETFADNKVPHLVLAFDSDAKEELILGNGVTDHMSVALAVQASMAMPWVMRHVKIGNIRATDGGSVHNFAIDVPNAPAIGIRVLGAKSQGRPWRWWPGYSWNHVDGMLRALEREHVEDGLWKKHKIVTIDSPISAMDFHKVDSEMVKRLFAIGYQAVRTKLDSGWGWRP